MTRAIARPLLGLLLFLVYAPFALAKTEAEIFAENRMAVVRVEMAVPNDKPSIGTGFIISRDGYVLTARHVLAGFQNNDTTPIQVRIGSLGGSLVEAELWNQDFGIDVALLKLRNPADVGLAAYETVKRGNSQTVKIGDPLYVVGFNLTNNISVGHGSLGTNLGGGTGGNLLWNVSMVSALFGMSGAPVFDANGLVVGLVKGGQPGTTILFVYPEDALALPASIAKWQQDSSSSTVSQGTNKVDQRTGEVCSWLTTTLDSLDAVGIDQMHGKEPNYRHGTPYTIPGTGTRVTEYEYQGNVPPGQNSCYVTSYMRNQTNSRLQLNCQLELGDGVDAKALSATLNAWIKAKPTARCLKNAHWTRVDCPPVPNVGNRLSSEACSYRSFRGQQGFRSFDLVIAPDSPIGAYADSTALSIEVSEDTAPH